MIGSYPITNEDDVRWITEALEEGDQFVVGALDHDSGEQWCNICDWEIGIDDYMYEEVGKIITVTRIDSHMTPSCGAAVFRVNENGFYWTVHWMKEYIPLDQSFRQPKWEL